MKKTLAILLACMLMMTLGSALAETINGTDTKTITTTATVEDPVEIDIAWTGVPTLTYSWSSANGWAVAADSNAITFTFQNKSPSSKKIVGSWSQTLAAKFGVAIAAPTTQTGTFFEGLTLNALMDAPSSNASDKLDVVTSTITDKTIQRADISTTPVLGSMTFTVSNP